MLKFYYNPVSSNARRVWVTLLSFFRIFPRIERPNSSNPRRLKEKWERH